MKAASFYFFHDNTCGGTVSREASLNYCGLGCIVQWPLITTCANIRTIYFNFPFMERCI